MRIHGRDCTLAVCTGGIYYPLPFSEETLREEFSGYYTEPVISRRDRSTFVITGRKATGCFVTALEETTVLPLFGLFAGDETTFDILVDRIHEKKRYGAMRADSFELRAENRGLFHLKVNASPTADTAVTDIPASVPAMEWVSGETLRFDGNGITELGEAVGFTYQMNLSGTCGDSRQYFLNLHTPTDDSSYLAFSEIIEGCTIPLGKNANLHFQGAYMKSSMPGVNCGDTVLAVRKFRISSEITVTAPAGNAVGTVTL
jgi:hypothetical protein